jgi:phosphate-selective porin
MRFMHVAGTQVQNKKILVCSGTHKAVEATGISGAVILQKALFLSDMSYDNVEETAAAVRACWCPYAHGDVQHD